MRHSLGKELENETRYLIVLLVDGEMASVVQMDFGVWQVAITSDNGP